MDALPDAGGNALPITESIPKIAAAFGKPLFSANMATVKIDGVLCAVIKLAEEQAELAAGMMLKVLDGTPISDLPVTKNKKGKRVLNVTTLKASGIKPKSHILQGVEFIKPAK